MYFTDNLDNNSNNNKMEDAEEKEANPMDSAAASKSETTSTIDNNGPINLQYDIFDPQSLPSSYDILKCFSRNVIVTNSG